MDWSSQIPGVADFTGGRVAGHPKHPACQSAAGVLDSTAVTAAGPGGGGEFSRVAAADAIFRRLRSCCSAADVSEQQSCCRVSSNSKRSRLLEAKTQCGGGTAKTGAADRRVSDGRSGGVGIGSVVDSTGGRSPGESICCLGSLNCVRRSPCNWASSCPRCEFETTCGWRKTSIASRSTAIRWQRLTLPVDLVAVLATPESRHAVRGRLLRHPA